MERRYSEDALMDLQSYRSTGNKEFKADIDENYSNYIFEVLATYDTKEEALRAEHLLHMEHNAKDNDNFYNRNNQTTTKFLSNDGNKGANRGKTNILNLVNQEKHQVLSEEAHSNPLLSHSNANVCVYLLNVDDAEYYIFNQFHLKELLLIDYGVSSYVLSEVLLNGRYEADYHTYKHDMRLSELSIQKIEMGDFVDYGKLYNPYEYDIQSSLAHYKEIQKTGLSYFAYIKKQRGEIGVAKWKQSIRIINSEAMTGKVICRYLGYHEIGLKLLREHYESNPLMIAKPTKKGYSITFPILNSEPISLIFFNNVTLISFLFEIGCTIQIIDKMIKNGVQEYIPTYSVHNHLRGISASTILIQGNMDNYCMVVANQEEAIAKVLKCYKTPYINRNAPKA